jgi:hypothetical protein
MAGTALAASVSDKALQSAILQALKATTAGIKRTLNFAKAVASTPGN